MNFCFVVLVFRRLSTTTSAALKTVSKTIPDTCVSGLNLRMLLRLNAVSKNLLVFNNTYRLPKLLYLKLQKIYLM
jgi:hypothetical protein